VITEGERNKKDRKSRENGGKLSKEGTAMRPENIKGKARKEKVPRKGQLEEDYRQDLNAACAKRSSLKLEKRMGSGELGAKMS